MLGGRERPDRVARRHDRVEVLADPRAEPLQPAEVLGVHGVQARLLAVSGPYAAARVRDRVQAAADADGLDAVRRLRGRPAGGLFGALVRVVAHERVAHRRGGGERGDRPGGEPPDPAAPKPRVLALTTAPCERRGLVVRGQRVDLDRGGGPGCDDALRDGDGVARDGDRRRPAEVARRGVAVLGRLGERAGDHRVELLRRGGRGSRDRGRVLGQVRPQLRLVVVVGVRRAAGQRVEEQAAEAVDVGAGVDPLAADLLRRDEVQRPDPVAGLRRALGDLALREAEVREVGVVVLAEQDVGGLDVAVDEPRGVRGVQRGRDLADDAGGAPGRERALAPDERPEVVAGHVAHRDVGDAALLARVVDRDDVGVVDRRRDLRLAQEAAPDRRVLHERGGDDLQRDLAVERELRRPVHDPHAAATRDRLDPVAGEAAPRRQLAHESGVYRPRSVQEHVGAETDAPEAGCARGPTVP